MRLTNEHSNKLVTFLNARVRVPSYSTEKDQAICDAWLSVFNSTYANKAYEKDVETEGDKPILVKAFYDATLFGADKPYPDTSGLPVETRTKFYNDTLAVWHEVFEMSEQDCEEFLAELKKELLLD